MEHKALLMKVLSQSLPGYPACREFIPVPITDDESLDIVFDVARKPGTNCLELYLEREPTSIDSQVNITTQIHVDNQVTKPVCYDNQIVVDGDNCNANPDTFLDPGPSDKSVLVLQDQHRSEAIWAGEDPGVLTCRQRLGTMMREWQLDHRIRHFVVEAGFYGVYRIGFIQLDWPLVTALVERWRQETHTFHFTVGESTVTLQDVAVLLGLRIHGYPVTGSADLQWDDLCEELLGVRPDPSVLHGSTLKLRWLRGHFQHLPLDADAVTMRCYARAYILGLLGSLFADKSGSDVQLIFLPLLRDFKYARKFSWGSAVLAYLYRELCRASKKGASEISGPLMLLQLWAWERLHIGRPERFVAQEQDPVIPDGEVVKNKVQVSGVEMVNQETLAADPLGCRWRSPVIRRDNPQRALIFYRDQLDQQTYDQMIWQPYMSELLVSPADVCVRDQHVWRTIAPLICFDIVEWHRPDRVLRQFGLKQGIPMQCDTEVKIHAIDRRGRHHYNWKAYHQQYIKLWASQEKSIVTAEPEESTMHYHDPYMKWYRSITRRLITPLTQRPHKRIQPASGMSHLLVHSLTNIHNQCTATLGTFTSESGMQSLTNIQIMCTRVLQTIGEIRHLETIQAPTTTMAPPSPSQANDMEGLPLLIAQMPAKTKSLSMRGRGRAKGRGRGLATQQKAMELVITSQQLSPQVVVASYTTPSQSNDIHIEEPSTLNLEGPTAPAESVHPLEGETTTEKVLLYPHSGSEESPCLTQVESSDVTRHKKKPKFL
ncbi:serine/threonine-protein phosphatase 7 long form homolog isoform X2 [Pistacia vera]|uniref:serine/threonine-protein phosphatase 7 long form homolog isoform X2 n=1 Tax=Pistacia vera TaxID=55513 RepID=UPI001263CDA6|nr:serine/threonine-protein phosphatase 7 long form homolog isoform X2 [Pistacia vera]XP_031266374.1 serine/threonine-protein phosphatase 7 long form homolog isoform X2 [Pistacia vera]